MIKKTLCFSNKAYLYCKNNQLMVRLEDIDTKQISEFSRPIEDIGIIVIDTGKVTITTSLMSVLLENKVALVMCDKKYMPSGLLLPLVGHTEQSERYEAQINASQPLRKQLWAQTVSKKIRNQAAVLKKANDTEIGNMLAWASEVKSGDPNNLEGRAAAYYWRNLFTECPGFVRRQEGELPNSLLNYGYAILRAVIARSLVASGLIPTLGIHHTNKYNAYCLADDIMEPYRPYVDLMVIDMIRNYRLELEITKQTKTHLLTIPSIDVKLKNLNRPLMVAASMTTASLAKCYLGESRKLVYPEIEL